MRFIFWGLCLLAIAVVAALIHFISPHATLRVATAPAGGGGQRLMDAIVTETKKEYPRVTFVPVPVDSLGAAAKAIEEHKADIGIIRSDISPPVNGLTLAIVRRDAVAFILPPKSPIDSIPKLSGKTVGIPQGPLQDANSALLDTILGYYNVASKDVKRVFLAPDEMVTAVRQRHVAAILAVGPVGPGEVANAVASMSKGSGGAPTLLAFSDADAFNKRFPGFESYDIPEGGFRSRPTMPDDTVTTLAVTYRLVSQDLMLDVTAGAIGRFLFTSKRKLVALTPAANSIEAPDPDDKNPILPVHPGVANYLNNGEQSFFDEFQSYFYLTAALLSVIGSLATVIMGRMRTGRMRREQKWIGEFILLADEAREADLPKLDILEEKLHKLIDTIVSLQGASGDSATMALAVDHARYSIAARKASLGVRSAGLHKLDPVLGESGAPLPATG